MSVRTSNVRKVVESGHWATPCEWHDTRMNDQSVCCQPLHARSNYETKINSLEDIPNCSANRAIFVSAKCRVGGRARRSSSTGVFSLCVTPAGAALHKGIACIKRD